MRDDFSCLVIGDGLESKYFKEELSKILPRERLNFTGKLVRSEVLRNFDNLRVLLSTAPTEGYGLAIREAMSAGLDKLELHFPHLISTFQTESEGVAVLDAALDTGVQDSEVLSFRRTLEFENESNLVSLIQSWLS